MAKKQLPQGHDIKQFVQYDVCLMLKAAVDSSLVI